MSRMRKLFSCSCCNYCNIFWKPLLQSSLSGCRHIGMCILNTWQVLTPLLTEFTQEYKIHLVSACACRHGQTCLKVFWNVTNLLQLQQCEPEKRIWGAIYISRWTLGSFELTTCHHQLQFGFITLRTGMTLQILEISKLRKWMRVFKKWRRLSENVSHWCDDDYSIPHT